MARSQCALLSTGGHGDRILATMVAEPALVSRRDAFSAAPMMEYTDAHQRKLMRLISRHSVLYTEMVTTNALVRNEEDPRRFLECDFDVEQPVVLQLGGSDPGQMKKASEIAVKWGYGEININCGCPSEKVADAGCFGAALMLNPALVVELAGAVGEATGRPATIKCRIGVNDRDSYDELSAFVARVSSEARVRHFIIHARKAILGAKFSPDDNRKIPPLKYDVVYRLTQNFPDLQFTLNGGINTLDETKAVLDACPQLAGVMVGRAIVNTPFHWSVVDSRLYQASDQNLSRRVILDTYAAYAARVEKEQGGRARRAVVKPLLGLFHGEPNGRLFRAKLDEFLLDKAMAIDGVILKAAAHLRDETLDLLPSSLGAQPP